LLRVSGPFVKKTKYVVSKIEDFVKILYYACLIPIHAFLVVIHFSIYVPYNPVHCGQSKSVGYAIDYGLDGPGSNPGGDEIFRPSKLALGPHPASCKMGTGSFPGVKCGQGMLLTTHPLLVPQSWNSRAIPLPTLWATPGL